MAQIVARQTRENLIHLFTGKRVIKQSLRLHMGYLKTLKSPIVLWAQKTRPTKPLFGRLDQALDTPSAAKLNFDLVG